MTRSDICPRTRQTREMQISDPKFRRSELEKVVSSSASEAGVALPSPSPKLILRASSPQFCSADPILLHTHSISGVSARQLLRASQPIFLHVPTAKLRVSAPALKGATRLVRRRSLCTPTDSVICAACTGAMFSSPINQGSTT